MGVVKKIYFWLTKKTMNTRGTFIGLTLKSVGKDFRIGKNIRISGPENIAIGNSVSIEDNCSLYGQGGISIGNNVMLASYVHLISQDHRSSKIGVPIKNQGFELGKITIEDDVWIGINVVILKNVTIGNGSIIGAGSIVTKDVPPFSISVGNPAKVIKTRRAIAKT